MGRWTYYSPLLLGTIIAAILLATYREFLAWQGAMLWIGGICVAGLAGLACQLLMLGVQGAFAQVLPAPSGRSIRGRGAVLTGGLILLALALGLVTAALHAEPGLTGWYWTAAALSVASLLAAIGAYAWNMPTAVRDFGDER